MCILVYIYACIEREREKQTERDRYMLHITYYISNHIHIVFRSWLLLPKDWALLVPRRNCRATLLSQMNAMRPFDQGPRCCRGHVHESVWQCAKMIKNGHCNRTHDEPVYEHVGSSPNCAFWNHWATKALRTASKWNRNPSPNSCPEMFCSSQSATAWLVEGLTRHSPRQRMARSTSQ